MHQQELSGVKTIYSGKRKILVIDDSVTIATVNQTALQKAGYDVILSMKVLRG